MAFIDQLTLAQDLTFRGRVKMAMLTAALQIANESSSDGLSQQYHQLRQQLAFQVIANPDTAERFSYTIVTNAAITGDSSDGDIQFTVNSDWDALAGIPASMRVA